MIGHKQCHREFMYARAYETWHLLMIMREHLVLVLLEYEYRS